MSGTTSAYVSATRSFIMNNLDAPLTNTDLVAFGNDLRADAIPAGLGKLLGGTNAAGTAMTITLGSNLTLSGGILNASGSGGGTYTGAAPVVVTGSAIGVQIGTTAGTLAAGNDTRIINALQPTAIPAAAGALLGGTSAAGSAVAITLGAGLSLSGNTLNAASNGGVSSGSAGSLAFYAANGNTLTPLSLGTNLTLSGSTLNATGGSGSSYTLPAATTATLGGVIPDGVSLTIATNGTLSVFGKTIDQLTDVSTVQSTDLIAMRRPAAGSVAAADYRTTPAELKSVITPPATISLLGGVKPDGNTIQAASDGTLSTITTAIASLPSGSALTGSESIPANDGTSSGGVDRRYSPSQLSAYALTYIGGKNLPAVVGLPGVPLTDGATIATTLTNGNMLEVTLNGTGHNFSTPTGWLPGFYTYFVKMGVASAVPVFWAGITWISTGAAAPTFSTTVGAVDVVTIAFSPAGNYYGFFAKGS